jgi:valyl-tRNA synthetase
LNKLIKECRKGYENFDFFIPANAIREFTWNLFASHYIEMVKPRAYGEGFGRKEKEAAWYTLHLVLKNLLKLFAPIAPFITDYVWMELYGKESIHRQSFPEPEWNFGLSKFTDEIVEFNTKVWKTKKNKGLSLKAEVEVKIPKNLERFGNDLKKMHNLRV